VGILDGELAFTESVPQVDGSVAGSRHDLTVVWGERDGENVLGVTDESSGGDTGVQVPKTKGLIPRSRQSELTVRRDSNVLDKVVVSIVGKVTGHASTLRGCHACLPVQSSLWVTVASFISGQVPDDDGLV
jgi:hypothetical protein